MQSELCLSKEDSQLSQEYQHLYPQIVGSLMHDIVNLRYDCAYTTSSLPQYLSTPAESHVQTLQHTLRYIKGTLPYRICYTKSPQGHFLHDYLM